MSARGTNPRRKSACVWPSTPAEWTIAELYRLPDGGNKYEAVVRAAEPLDVHLRDVFGPARD